MSHYRELADLIAQHTATDGVHATSIPRLSLIRMSQPTEPLHAVHQPSLCIVVQGKKQVMLCEQMIDYSAGRHLVVSVDVPIVGQVVQATTAEPYLCLRLDLDLPVLGDLVLSMNRTMQGTSGCKALGVGDTPPHLLDAAVRLLRLLNQPDHAPYLAPLIEREMLYHLLCGEQASVLHQILTPNNRLQNVNRAISWIKENYRKSFSIERIAEEARMSTSSLHEHFRDITNMSPLQYQKQLRLQEARRLILTHAMDAATAGHRVGYDSPSQFSREYRRQFGAPPLKDVTRLRAEPERFAEA